MTKPPVGMKLRFEQALFLEGLSQLWEEDTGKKFSTQLNWWSGDAYPGNPLKEIRFQQNGVNVQ